MAKIYLVLIFLVLSLAGFSQLDKVSLEAFQRKIKAVKYADLGVNETALKMIVSRGANESSDIIAIKQFVTEDFKLMGAIVTPEDREIVYMNCNSITEIVSISWKAGAFESELGAIGNYPFTIIFSFADKSQYTFSFPVNVSGLTMSMPKAIIRGLRKSIGEINPKIPPLKINLINGAIVYTENELIKYFENNESKNNVEGVYKLVKGAASISKLAIAQKNGKYYLLNIQNKYFIDDWKYGETRGEIESTMGKSIFTGTFYLIDKQVEEIVLTIKEENIIEISNPSGGEALVFIKIK